jgi:hypothetical protein
MLHFGRLQVADQQQPAHDRTLTEL